MKIKYTNKDTSRFCRKRNTNKLQPILDAFMERSEVYMCLTYDKSDGYKNVQSMYTSWKNATRRSGHALKVWKDGDQIWFEKIVKPESP